MFVAHVLGSAAFDQLWQTPGGGVRIMNVTLQADNDFYSQAENVSGHRGRKQQIACSQFHKCSVLSQCTAQHAGIASDGSGASVSAALHAVPST